MNKNKRTNQEYPAHIRPVHFEEWVSGSGVSREITTLNVRSLDDPAEIDKLLNRNNKQHWKHWEHGEGWSVSGIDPMTDEACFEGCQFKPDRPVQRVENGQPKFKRNGEPDLQKYFSASDYEAAPLFLDTGVPGYWQSVLADSTRRLLVTEGAKKAGAALTVGEACISLPGVTTGQRKGRLKKILQQFCSIGRVVVLAFDSDLFHNPNVCKALDKLGRLIATCGAVVRVLMLPKDTKGIDDFIVKYGAEAFHSLVSEALSFEEWRDEYLNRKTRSTAVINLNPDEPDPLVPLTEENYTLRAQGALYSADKWISVDGSLYRWCGTHYEQQVVAVEKQRISEWCKVTPVLTNGRWEFKYATSAYIEGIWAWVVANHAVDPSLVNPPGLNCLNGVLTLEWEGCNPKWRLVPHNPSVIYTYVGQFEFDPNADPTNCDRLLECLETGQRGIFIKTLAASLDLKAIRSLRGRSIKALLCKGEGNNGKDSLREAVQTLYGVGVVDCPIEDFVTYQQGRKFPLTKLGHARVSWASENSNIAQLDSIQPLKRAITGETLDFELKNEIERPMNPCCIFLFNINNVPNLQASLEAIKSRWAVLSFAKVFKTNADPSKGELEADPRFRYDPTFLQKEVVPALLNKMLAALPEVAAKGIDYSCTEQALKEIQRETNHLWAFCQDVGLGYQVGGRVYIGELHTTLIQWYIDNGYLEVTTDAKGKEKKDWSDPSHRGDKLVKGSKDVWKSFSALFPKITKERDYSHGDRHGLYYLSGISFGSPMDHHLDHHLDHQKPAQEAMDHHGSPISPTLHYVLDVVSKLPPTEFKLLNKLLNTMGGKMVIHGDPRLPERVSGDPNGDPNGDPLVIQKDTPTVSITGSNASLNGVTAPVASNAVGHVGNVSQDNSTKNFDRKPSLKVGDKCIAKYSNIYGIPKGA
jgi:putative DNA primase/helicase